MTWRPYTIIMLITTYGIVVMATIVASPASPLDQSITVITLSLLAGEVHYLLVQERLQLRRYVWLPISSVVIAAVLSIGVIAWRPIYRQLTADRYKQELTEAQERSNENRRRAGLFDEKGWTSYELHRDFELSRNDEYDLKGSMAGRALLRHDSTTFAEVMNASDEILRHQYFSVHVNAVMTERFVGFQQRVQQFLDALPGHLRAIEEELMATQIDPQSVKEIEERRQLLRSLYDSLAIGIRRSAPVLEKEVLDISHILSQPSYWNIAADPPMLMRPKIKLWKSNASTRGTKAWRIIHQSRRGIRAYRALLQRNTVEWP